MPNFLVGIVGFRVALPNLQLSPSPSPRLGRGAGGEGDPLCIVPVIFAKSLQPDMNDYHDRSHRQW